MIEIHFKMQFTALLYYIVLVRIVFLFPRCPLTLTWLAAYLCYKHVSRGMFQFGVIDFLRAKISLNVNESFASGITIEHGC